jgi:SAM-dependent methyltransferase
MAFATAWYWVIGVACVIAFAVTARRVFRRVARRVIRVREGGRELSVRERVLLRYQGGAFHPLFFAWCKTWQDAMFDELPGLLSRMKGVRVFLDLGCGFGVAGAFLLEQFAGSEIYGVDPNPERVAGARAAWGERGHAIAGAAPDFEKVEFPARFDGVFSLDVVHFLDDAALDLTLKRIRTRLDVGRYLILRAPMLPVGSGSLTWKLARIHYKAWGLFSRHRTEEQLRERIEKAGFVVEETRKSGGNPELRWFVSVAVPLQQEVEGFVAEPVASVGDDREQQHG